MKREAYQRVEMEIIRFEAEDVITTSSMELQGIELPKVVF